MSDWLRQNHNSLELAKRASKKKRYYSPIMIWWSPEEEGIRHVRLEDMYSDPLAWSVPSMTEALAARAMWYAGQGRLDEAWDDLRASHRLARLVAQGPLLAHADAAAESELATLDATLALIARTQRESARLKKIEVDWRRLAPMPSVADKIDTGTRYAYLDIVTRMPRKRLGFFLYFYGDHLVALRGLAWLADRPLLWATDWDKVLRRANQWFDESVAIARLPPGPPRLDAHRKLHNEMYARWYRLKEWAKATSFQRYLLDALLRFRYLATEGFSWVLPQMFLYYVPFDKLDEIAAKHRMLGLMFALADYRDRHGSYPEKLGQLKPFLPGGIPQDPYSDTGFRYVPTDEGYLLYSVGPDGEDQGGQNDPHVGPSKDDIAVRVPIE